MAQPWLTNETVLASVCSHSAGKLDVIAIDTRGPGSLGKERETVSAAPSQLSSPWDSAYLPFPFLQVPPENALPDPHLLPWETLGHVYEHPH